MLFRSVSDGRGCLPAQSSGLAQGPHKGHRPSHLSGSRCPIPLRRQGTGWDIGWAAVFLASDEAGFNNGHLPVVDGGMTVQFRPD